MLERKIYVGSNDVDSNFDLKMSSFFKMMQDIAVEHSEMLGVGHHQTIDKGVIWIINRFQVQVNEMPKYRQNVILKTYPGKTNKFIFPRHFILLDENNNVLIRASSTWLVLSKDTRRIVMSPFENNDLPYEVDEGELPMPGKIEASDTYFIENRKVRYNDIDLNGHLNNTKYIDYIFDLHNSSFYSKYVVKDLLINYNHEIKDGDVVELYSNGGNPESISGRINGLNIFDVKITYKQK